MFLALFLTDEFVQLGKQISGVAIPSPYSGGRLYGHQFLLFQDQSWVQREKNISESIGCTLIKR